MSAESWEKSFRHARNSIVTALDDLGFPKGPMPGNDWGTARADARDHLVLAKAALEYVLREVVPGA